MTEELLVTCEECQWKNMSNNQTGAHCTGVTPPTIKHECVAFKQREHKDRKQ